MSRKRLTLDERIERLKVRIYEAEPRALSSTSGRRTLAGLRAALSVMEAARTRGDKEYCKS